MDPFTTLCLPGLGGMGQRGGCHSFTVLAQQAAWRKRERSPALGHGSPARRRMTWSSRGSSEKWGMRFAHSTNVKSCLSAAWQMLVTGSFGCSGRGRSGARGWQAFADKSRHKQHRSTPLGLTRTWPRNSPPVQPSPHFRKLHIPSRPTKVQACDLPPSPPLPKLLQLISVAQGNIYLVRFDHPG